MRTVQRSWFVSLCPVDSLHPITDHGMIDDGITVGFVGWGGTTRVRS